MIVYLRFLICNEFVKSTLRIVPNTESLNYGHHPPHYPRSDPVPLPSHHPRQLPGLHRGRCSVRLKDHLSLFRETSFGIYIEQTKDERRYTLPRIIFTFVPIRRTKREWGRLLLCFLTFSGTLSTTCTDRLYFSSILISFFYQKIPI